MSFKAKTVYNKDIRVFSKNIDNFKDCFKDVQEFVKEKYQIEQPFLIQYQDDEDDYVTIGSAEDLEEAYRHSQESDKILKLFIVPEEIGIPVSEINKGDGIIENKDTAEDQKQENKDEETTTSSDSSDSSSSEDNEEPCHPFHQLIKDLRENEEFREEFVNFATTFVVSVQENVNNAVGDAFNQSLSAHDTVKKHPGMAKFGELLTQFPFAVGLLSSIDPDQIGEYIKMALQLASYTSFPPPHVMHALPPWMHMMVGPMFTSFSGGATPFGPPPPPFGTHPPHHHGPFFGHGPFRFGHHHGHHGHHHRHGKKFGKCGKGNKCEQDGPFPYGPSHQPPHSPQPRCGFGGHRFGRGGFWHHFARQNQAQSEYDGKIIRSNLTLEDDAYVLPEQVVVKTWLVKNTGKVNWPEGGKICYVGNPFNPIIDGVEFPVQSLKVGEEAEVNVVIKAPKEDGIYRSRWRLCLPNGLKFGECLKCRITVVNDEEKKIEKPKSDEKKQKKKKDKQEKLLKHRAKLETKLSKVVNQIAKADRKQKMKAVKQASVLDKIDEEMQELSIPVDPESFFDNGDVPVEDVSAEKKIEEPKANESVSVEIIEDEDMEIDAIEIPQEAKPNENVPALPPFEYEVELASLLDMGFEDTEKIKALLRKHKGNVPNVITNLFH